MRLLRYGDAGAERPGILDRAGRVRDLSAHAHDVGPECVTPEELERLAAIDVESLPVVEDPGRIGSCLSHVPNFHCIGLNYANHALETGTRPPDEPIIFSKSTSALSGPNDPIPLPVESRKGDWEVELGIVIGRVAFDVSEADALDHVAGYCTVNDVSEREFQMERAGQWVKGKSLPGFGPVGPWFVTADEVPDPQALKLWLKLNDRLVQQSDTSDMIFGVAFLVSYLSRFMRLLPGDLIATGTPAGVGMGMNPPRFLQIGDVMELEVEGLGQQRQEVVAAG